MQRLTRSRTSRVLTGALIVFAAGTLIDASFPLRAQSDKKPKRTKIREASYYYSAFNRRDPFRSLVLGDFVSEKRMSPVDLGRVELVGIVRGDLDRFVMLEDNKGFSYILRIGDRVKNGSVVAIGDESMVARVTNFGQTRKFTLHLASRALRR